MKTTRAGWNRHAKYSVRVSKILLGVVCLAVGLVLGTSSAQASATGIHFDGTNDYVTFGSGSGLGLGTFTIETWFKRDGAGVSTSTGTGGVTAVPLVSKGRAQSDGSNVDMNYFFGIRASDNVLVADFEEGATGATPGLNHPISGLTPIALNTWYHAAVTYDGVKWQLFLNGVLESELTVAQPPRSDSIQHAGLGTAMTSTGAAAGFFSGTLDEVRIWNYARTAQEILSSKCSEISSATGLVGRWGMNEGSGTSVTNSAGTVITGSLLNGPTWATGYPEPGSPNCCPIVCLMNPTNNAGFLSGSTININVCASDADGTVSKVEFFCGGTKLGETTNYPHAYAWNDVPAGAFSVSALATDNSGESVMATPAGIEVASASNTTNNIFGITQSWKYQTINLNGINWKAPNYDDSAWQSGPALLYVESNTAVAPRNTLLPGTAGALPPTYYFRTHFTFSESTTDISLLFSNKLDDGAVFYLNGTEIQRVRMNPNPSYTSLSTAQPPGGDATVFDIFTISGDLITNLVTGDNVLAVEVHQSAANSSDIVFGSTLSSYVASLSVVRGPYLQAGSPTNIVVRWRTSLPSNGVVRYGSSVGSLTMTADDPNVGINHEVVINGLSPNTTNFYSIGTTTETLAGGDATHFFVTSPLPGTSKPTRIWVIGDSGTGTGPQAAVRQVYYNFTGTRHTDLWLALGDNAYNDGWDNEYQSFFFNVYPEMLRKSVCWSTLGNHETRQIQTLSDNYDYFSIFTMPTNGQAGGLPSGSEHYYSFDYGNIHFICLDSMTSTYRATNSVMMNWLKNDMASSSAAWMIAFFHHPPYTKGTHNSDTEAELIQMRQNFMPVLEAGGIDLVLAGHSHAYERSFLIDGHYGSSSTFTSAMQVDGGDGRTNGAGAYQQTGGGNHGAVYIVAGSSGQSTSNPIWGQSGQAKIPAMYISLNNLGSLVLDVNDYQMDVKYLRQDGVTNDYFTIQKAIGETKITASDGQSGDILGSSAAISTNIAVTGAVLDDDRGYGAGAAYVYRFNGASWVQEAKLLASDGNDYDEFGVSVGASGNTVIVGQHEHYASDIGSAYIYRHNGSSWVQEAKLVPSDGVINDHFGHSVAISGNVALIGARFDSSVVNDSGSAYVFRYNGSSWVQEAELKASDAAFSDFFGTSVALSNDVAVVGSYYDDDNGTDSGSAYVFRYNGSAWVQEAKLLASDGAAQDWFGVSVGISGGAIIVGTVNRDDAGYDSGAAYIFRYNGTSWSQEAKLLASDGAAQSRFGYAVGISGNNAVIGAYNKQGPAGWEQGASYIFQKVGSTWVQRAKLLASDAAASDYFGISTAISGSRVIVGSNWDDDNGSNSGSAYIYLLP